LHAENTSNKPVVSFAHELSEQRINLDMPRLPRALTLTSGEHVRVYASTDMPHLILEITSGKLAPTIVRLVESNARALIGQLQSAVDMIRAVNEPATPNAKND
jgi:hypothetical protein